MRLYFTPGACSLSCHIALEESGLSYELQEISTARGENREPAYRKIHSLGSVPALAIDDDTVLTEAAAILAYIGDQVPDRALLPAAGTLARARAQEWFNFLSSGLHIGFRSVFRPERFGGPDPAVMDQVRAKGIETVTALLTEAQTRLGAGPFVLGDRFSLCDAYLTVFYNWSRRPVIAPHLPGFPGLQAWAAGVIARPAVARVLQRENLVLA